MYFLKYEIFKKELLLCLFSQEIGSWLNPFA